MSTEEAQSRDANPGKDAGESPDTTAYRRHGARLLDEKPERTAAMFAGRMFDEFGMSPERAADLYADLAETEEPEPEIEDEGTTETEDIVSVATGETDDNTADSTSDLKPALRALGDVIEFYHEQLDREIPVKYAETARGYFESVRGWKPNTVGEKRLGYAPADCKDELISYLHDRGHDREAILSSGLFYEGGLKPHFNGRFVLPYCNESGEPVYAISRSIDEDGGGHPGDHHGDQKYTKAVKTKEYSDLDEPIYGLSSVDHDTDEVLVAGGIADAITLHEGGFACISPVTTVRFKGDHEDRVLELIDEYGIDRVYIVNDAERPTVDAQELEDDETPDQIGDILTIQQWGEGLRGAFRNAEFLQDASAETYLVDLPAGGGDLRKLDPDDYVKENWGDVETLLASATPAAHHAGYSSWRAARQERAVDAAARTSPDSSASSGSRSALFSFNIKDVTGESIGFRGNNPLGHHGDSENYFVIVEKHGDRYGYDHKYGVAYNALTYLACEAGERRASDPNGKFDDETILKTWAHAKAERYVDDDDPIPTRALEHAARTLTEWNGEFIKRETADGGTFDALPADIYNDALDAVAEEYGVEPGREPIKTDTRSGYYDADLAAFVDDDTDPWINPDTMLRACLRARDAGAVSEHVAPPTMALLPLRRDVLGQQSDRDMSSGTKDLLEDLFHELEADELDDVLGSE